METAEAIEPTAKNVRRHLKAHGLEHLLGKAQRDGLDMRLVPAVDSLEATRALFDAVSPLWHDGRTYLIDCGAGHRHVYVDRRGWQRSRPLALV